MPKKKLCSFNCIALHSHIKLFTDQFFHYLYQWHHSKPGIRLWTALVK